MHTSVRFLWRWRRMVVCECNGVVAQSLSYPTQLATHRHLPPSPQNSDTCVHCRASIFGNLRPPSSTHWIFFGENRRRIDRDFKSFCHRHSVCTVQCSFSLMSWGNFSLFFCPNLRGAFCLCFSRKMAVFALFCVGQSGADAS